MPVFAVCVHDQRPQGDAGHLWFGGVVGAGRMHPHVATLERRRSGPTDGRAYVEVRMCYRFDPLLTVPLGELGIGVAAEGKQLHGDQLCGELGSSAANRTAGGRRWSSLR